MISLENISITQGKHTLEDISIQLKEGGYYGIVGGSGAGKTTLLEMICGLRMPKSGAIYFNHKLMNDVPPGERDLGYVPQDYSLFQAMSVFDNIAFSLTLRKVEKRDIKEKVNEIAQVFHIENLLHQWPRSLSGGEQQRVAIARALIFKPRVLCLDEPFAALDAENKNKIMDYLSNYMQENNCTILHVAHDIEALEQLAQEVILVKDGKVSMVEKSENIRSYFS